MCSEGKSPGTLQSANGKLNQAVVNETLSLSDSAKVVHFPFHLCSVFSVLSSTRFSTTFFSVGLVAGNGSCTSVLLGGCKVVVFEISTIEIIIIVYNINYIC